MMDIPDNFIRSAIEASMTGIIAIGGGIGSVFLWFARSFNNRISKIERESDEHKEKLAEFQMDAERRYAKEDATQASLNRIHQRLDQLPSDVCDLMAKSLIIPQRKGDHHGL